MARNNSTDTLGSERIMRLLIQYSIPAIIATAASSLYNVIDRIFIGHGVGPLAISGLALTLPLMNLAAAFGALVGVGASTMISIRLGQRNRKEATLILGNALMLNLIIGISFSILFLIFLDSILFTLGASDETLLYAKEFIQVILVGNVITHIYLGLNSIMRASGFPRKSMYITLTTVGVNLVLAPLFIFVFRWGIRGAALATVCSQVVGVIWVFTHFMKKSSPIRFLPGYFKLKRRINLDIFSIGMSNFLMLICASLVVVVINRSLKVYGGDYAIGAFGIINSLVSLFAMIVIGFNQGMQPIAGYNYGAANLSRVFKVFKGTVIAGTGVTVLGFLICEIFPRQLASAFTSNQQLIDIAVTGMRISILMFPIVGFQMVTSTLFQSIGKAKISIFLVLSRQLLFLIPALLIIPQFWGLRGVWCAIPVADLTSSLLTFFVLSIQLKKLR